jgi:anti-anti-sigma regulatory factor
MPTEITQVDAADSNTTILRVSGEMMDGDAKVVESVAKCIREETGREIIIDLADLDLLDSEAAPALRRISGLDGISIEGVEVLLQASIDQAERHVG